MAFAVEQVQRLSWLRPFITIGAVLGLGSVVLVMLLGQSRVFYSMSRDGLIGPWAGKVHPRFRTPYLSTIYVGIIVAVITGTFPIQILGELVNIGTLLAFVLVCAGVMDPPEDAARPGAAVPDAAGAAGADPRHPGLLRPHGHAAGATPGSGSSCGC